MNDVSLQDIARHACQRGDTAILFASLDLLERVLPFTNNTVDEFMAFCSELEAMQPNPTSGRPRVAQRSARRTTPRDM